jgi:ABC-type sulfate transport system substrate-binding protein
MKKLMAVLAFTFIAATARAEDPTLLNVSYDIAREFYKEINAGFVADYKKKTGKTVTINQSHGGSSKQARSVIDGLKADVVTMNQETDIDAIAQAGLLAKDWRTRFPHNAAPYTSTIVFLVRKGNPKGIKDWSDLAKTGVSVVIPNPKTSGNGRYSYLAAWGYAQRQYDAMKMLKEKGLGEKDFVNQWTSFANADEAAKDFVARLFKNVPVLDTGGRGATTTFVQRGIGDALLTFEAEILLITKEIGKGQFDVIVPPLSIESDAPVAIVDKVVAKKGTRDLAKAYLDYHYSAEGQDIAARNFFRPRDAAVAAKYASTFPKIELLTVKGIAGDWAKAQKTHFADGGVFDQIYGAK